MARTRPLRLGYFTYHQGTKPQSEIYADVLELFERAEQVGFDSAWVAQHHFGHHGGLPSPFVFFAAVAARTTRLRLGTAIIALPLENPVRVAEDAAVFETLYPGRLELGLGTGFASEAVLETFGHPGGDRRELYDRNFPLLVQALARRCGECGGRCAQPACSGSGRPNLGIASLAGTNRRDRAAWKRAAAVAYRDRRGDRPSHEIQIPLVERYLAELPSGGRAAYRVFANGLSLQKSEASAGQPDPGTGRDGCDSGKGRGASLVPHYSRRPDSAQQYPFWRARACHRVVARTSRSSTKLPT